VASLFTVRTDFASCCGVSPRHWFGGARASSRPTRRAARTRGRLVVAARKINGRYLTPWLAALEEETVADLPHSGGLAVQTDLHRDVVAS